MDSGFIRKAVLHDLNDIIKIERKCFRGCLAYSPKQLKYLLLEANSNFLLETIQEAIRGFIIILYKRNSEIAGVETLNVDPFHQGKGIGKKLLNAAELDMLYRGITKVRLEVSTGNKRAISLYEKSGFRITRLLKNYYQYEHHDSYDAFRLVKTLTT
jgi:ribosomal protein S18 acetylase RimI-like enzyme